MKDVLSLIGLIALSACDAERQGPEPGHAGAVASSRIVGESAAGRASFVQQGCVMCHSVNGVGGKAAPALDAEIGAPEVDPLDFAARMWSGAPAMIELQSIELGYTISLTGKDIADIAAFSGDIDEQKRLSADQIPAGMRDSLLDQRFWEMEDWDDFLRKGEEGYGEPETPEDSAKATPETP